MFLMPFMTSIQEKMWRGDFRIWLKLLIHRFRFYSILHIGYNSLPNTAYPMFNFLITSTLISLLLLIHTFKCLIIINSTFYFNIYDEFRLCVMITFILIPDIKLRKATITHVLNICKWISLIFQNDFQQEV